MVLLMAATALFRSNLTSSEAGPALPFWACARWVETAPRATRVSRAVVPIRILFITNPSGTWDGRNDSGYTADSYGNARAEEAGAQHLSRAGGRDARSGPGQPLAPRPERLRRAWGTPPAGPPYFPVEGAAWGASTLVTVMVILPDTFLNFTL